MADVRSALAQQNMVIDAGSIDLGDDRMRFQVAGDFGTIEEIADYVIEGRTLSEGQSGRLFRLRDIADVRRGYIEPSSSIMRQDGRPSVAVAVSNVPGVNIVTVGANIDQRLLELEEVLPAGIEVRRIWQTESQRGRSAHRSKMAGISRVIDGGGSLTEAFQHTDGYFPEIVLDFVRVGEQTGKLAEIFTR